MTLYKESKKSELIEVEPAHKILNFRTKNEKCKLLNSTVIASGYVGRDPQRGTSDGSLFSKFSFKIQRMVKVHFQFFKKKIKINYNEVRQKVRDQKDGETRIGYVQRNGKGVIKEVGVVGVGDLN